MKYLERSFLWQYYRSRTDVEQMLILGNLFSLSLVAWRMIYTGNLLFAFLPWNLFLAYVPYALSSRMKERSFTAAWKFILYAFAWLLFIPNSFYILTDLFHLDMNNEEVPLWFDLALLLSFAWNGLLYGILSVRQMEKLFRQSFNKNADLLFILPVMALNGLGIYIGRYLRFNSLDVLTNPFHLTNEMIYLFTHPIHRRFDWSMIICYSVLLTLIYYTLKRLSKVL